MRWALGEIARQEERKGLSKQTTRRDDKTSEPNEYKYGKTNALC